MQGVIAIRFASYDGSRRHPAIRKTLCIILVNKAPTSPGREGKEKTTEVLNARGSSDSAIRGSRDSTMKRVTLSRASWMLRSRIFIPYSSAARSLAIAATSLRRHTPQHFWEAHLLACFLYKPMHALNLLVLCLYMRSLPDDTASSASPHLIMSLQCLSGQ